MSSSASALFKVELQGAGDNVGTWHVPLNMVATLLEEAIAKFTTVTLTGSDQTLTDTQYVSNESRAAGIVVAGTATASKSIIVPDRQKIYFVKVSATISSSYTVTLKPSGGTGITLTTGTNYIVRCDGAGALTTLFSSAARPVLSVAFQFLNRN